MVSKWVITPIYPIYRQVIPHVLTIDPNFQRDIQVHHPSSTGQSCSIWNGRSFGWSHQEKLWMVAFEGIKLDAKCCWWIWGIKIADCLVWCHTIMTPCFQRFLDLCCSPKKLGERCYNNPVLTCVYFSALCRPTKTTNKPMKFHGTWLNETDDGECDGSTSKDRTSWTQRSWEFKGTERVANPKQHLWKLEMENGCEGIP